MGISNKVNLILYCHIKCPLYFQYSATLYHTPVNSTSLQNFTHNKISTISPPASYTYGTQVTQKEAILQERVFMYVCTYACTYVCMYVCIFVDLYVCVCMFVCMYVPVGMVKWVEHPSPWKVGDSEHHRFESEPCWFKSGHCGFESRPCGFESRPCGFKSSPCGFESWSSKTNNFKIYTCCFLVWRSAL